MRLIPTCGSTPFYPPHLPILIPFCYSFHFEALVAVGEQGAIRLCIGYCSQFDLLTFFCSVRPGCSFACLTIHDLVVRGPEDMGVWLTQFRIVADLATFVGGTLIILRKAGLDDWDEWVSRWEPGC